MPKVKLWLPHMHTKAGVHIQHRFTACTMPSTPTKKKRWRRRKSIPTDVMLQHLDGINFQLPLGPFSTLDHLLVFLWLPSALTLFCVICSPLPSSHVPRQSEELPHWRKAPENCLVILHQLLHINNCLLKYATTQGLVQIFKLYLIFPPSNKVSLCRPGWLNYVVAVCFTLIFCGVLFVNFIYVYDEIQSYPFFYFPQIP